MTCSLGLVFLLISPMGLASEHPTSLAALASLAQEPAFVGFLGDSGCPSAWCVRSRNAPESAAESGRPNHRSQRVEVAGLTPAVDGDLDRQVAVAMQQQEAHELTGSLVESDKPVAVYSGNDLTYVPAASQCTAASCCCGDLISTAVPPTTTYGTRYAGVKLLPIGDAVDVWRIIGDHDDTEVTLSGDEQATLWLDAGEFVDVLSTGVFALAADKPVGLAHFMAGGSSTSLEPAGFATHDCADALATPGDPALSWMYPVDNWLGRYVFEVGVIANGGSSWCHDHLTVVTDSSAWAKVTLDGAALPAPTPVGEDTGLSYAYVPVGDGTHELLAPKDVGVEVSVYGYSTHGSYLFPAGMGLVELNPYQPN